MGWLDYRQHIFRAAGINKLLSEDRPQIIYDYDFGGGWEVSIVLRYTARASGAWGGRCCAST